MGSKVRRVAQEWRISKRCFSAPFLAETVFFTPPSGASGAISRFYARMYTYIVTNSEVLPLAPLEHLENSVLAHRY